LLDCIPKSNWKGTNQDIDKISVPKAAHADAAAARTALQPQVTARFGKFVTATAVNWNAIITKDKPGKGGRGYAAGKKVLQKLIQAVRAYATTKGWTGKKP